MARDMRQSIFPVGFGLKLKLAKLNLLSQRLSQKECEYFMHKEYVFFLATAIM